VTDVWARPVDVAAARFLGYATVLEGAAVSRVLEGAPATGDPPPTALALRRSALVLDPVGRLAGRVLSARSTPDAVRLVVDLDGVGEVHAVAAPGAGAPGVGHVARFVLDLTRTARLGDPERGRGTA
jgi:thiamine transport system ATP-binding protein